MLRTVLLVVAALALTAAGCRTARPDAPATPDSTTASVPMPAEPTAPTAPAAPSEPGAQRPMGPGQGEPIEVPLGETAQRDGHAIRFVSVVEDSRCPQNVDCVWAGRATVAMEIDGTPVTLTVPHGAQRDEETSSLEIGRIAVEVVGLDPYPGSPEAEAGEPVVVRAVTRGAGM